MAKRGIVSHPKTLDLAERLGIMECYAVGILESFWQWVASYHPDGDLTGTKPTIFGRSIGYRGNAEKVWNALIEAGFIDLHDEKFIVHDWPEHAEDSIHIRLARSRAFFADGTVPKFNRIGNPEREHIKQDFDRLMAAVRVPSVRTESDDRGALPSPSPKPTPKPKPSSSPATRSNETTIVGEALAEFGILIDDDGIRRLIKACRENVPDATVEEIAQVARGKIDQALRAKNPVGFLLHAVPKYFTEATIARYREALTGDLRRPA